MSEEAKKSEVKKSPPAPKKSSYNVVTTANYIIVSSDDFVLEVSRGGHAKFDGVRAAIGASFKDIKETRKIRKLSKADVDPKLIEKEIASQRKNIVGVYRDEVLEKLIKVGVETDKAKDIVAAIEDSHIESLLD